MNALPNIMLVGIQGSGKGTQARKIVEHFGYKLFDTGAELRKIAATDTELGKNVKKIIESGNYVPAEYIRDTIGAFLRENTDYPALFDGPIRSEEQDQIIRPMIGKCLIIYLQLDEKAAIKRLIERRIDPETGETFPGDFPGNINPKTGNILITRKDDNEEAIKNRISWSMNESLPLIEKWKNEGYTVKHIDASTSIDEVFQSISHIISSFQ